VTAILTPNLEVPGRRSLHKRNPDPDADRFGHLAVCDRPSVVFDELTEELAYALVHRDRNVQVEPGPSDLSTECDRALAGAVACLPEPGDERAVNWRADVGTAIHAMFEGIIRRSLNNTHPGNAGPRWLVETELTIGYIDGRRITGHCDLFDLMALGVIDYKSKSKTQLLISRRGLSLTYRRQLNLYGYGWEQLGLTPNWVGCLFLPRDGEWNDGFPHAEPYDRELALATLERADTMARIVRAIGVEAAMASYEPCGSKWCRWCPPPGRTYRQSGAEERIPEGEDAFG
jgi:hypothetical protein